MQFIPDLKVEKRAVPWFEERSKFEVPGRETTKSVDVLQREITDLLTKLGAYSAYFVAGVYPGKPQRYGYQVHFRYANTAARADVIALPIQHETPAKKRQAVAQALFLFRDKLKATYFAMMYEPEGIPLLPYLIGSNGKTVTEGLIENGMLPMLGDGRSR